MVVVDGNILNHRRLNRIAANIIAVLAEPAPGVALSKGCRICPGVHRLALDEQMRR
jgi:hypothetical protein